MKHLCIVIYVAFLSVAANAGLYLEPYVAYETGSNKGDLTITGLGELEIDLDSAGFGGGAKVGYSFASLAVGVDYHLAALEEKDNTDTEDDDHGTVNELGAFVSFGLPMIRLGATYLIDAKSKNNDSEASGSGYKLTLSYTGLPLVSINVDYTMINYDDIDIDDVPGDLIDDVDIDRSMLALGVSFPIDF